MTEQQLIEGLIEQSLCQEDETRSKPTTCRVCRGLRDRSDIGEEIHRITIPTLVMTGREDPAATPAQAEFISAQIPGTALQIIDDASHLAGIEKPLEIAKLARDFLVRTAAV